MAHQYGWLHAVPSDDHDNSWPHNRLEQRRREGLGDGIPALDFGQYLIEAFMEVGPVSSGITGPEPITWQDIAGYKAATEAISEPWEARALMSMSRYYITGLSEGSNVLSIAPVDRDHSND